MIPDPDTFKLFLLASIVLLVLPGPAIVYIVTRSITQGYRAGLVAAAGVQLGTMFHVVAAAFGLSALLMTSTMAFSIVKTIGAVYLIYLGLKSLFYRSPDQQIDIIPNKQLSKTALKAVFRESVIVNTFNPKVAIFFLAFLPQFITPGKGDVHYQILFLGGVLMVLGLITDSLFALLGGSLREVLFSKWHKAEKYIAGVVYTGLGIFTLFLDANSLGANTQKQ